jgi:hypothetical protein
MPEPAVVEIIGQIELPKRGHIVHVALVDWSNDFGIGIDVRTFVTDARWDKVRAARARAALNGRRFEGAHDERRLYTGPTKQGILLQPSDADELTELLARAVLKVEALFGDQEALTERAAISQS